MREFIRKPWSIAIVITVILNIAVLLAVSSYLLIPIAFLPLFIMIPMTKKFKPTIGIVIFSVIMSDFLTFIFLYALANMIGFIYVIFFK